MTEYLNLNLRKMYAIHDFDQSTGYMTFKIDVPGGENIYVSINVKKGMTPNFSDYREKPRGGYVREDTGAIEIVGTMFALENPFRAVPPPFLVQTIDGVDVNYNLATQYDYDKWSSREFPDDDNAKVFNLLEGLTKDKAESMCN